MSIFGDKIVGIDFHDYSVEIAELSLHGENRCLESYNRAIIPADVIVNGEIKKKEDLKLILKSMLQNGNPNPIATKNVAITFPSSKVMTHIFQFPANLSKEEVKKAITYQAETVIPFSISDIYWDSTVLEKEDESIAHSSQYVLFACINKQVADKYCDLFEEMDMIPVLFSVPCDTLRYSLPEEMLLGKTSLIIDMDTLAVNYIVIKNLVVKHFFSVNEGGHKLITELEKESQLTDNVIIDLKEKNKLNTIQGSDIIKNFLNRNYKRGKLIVEEFEAKNKGEKIDQVLLTGKFINLPDSMKIAKSYFPRCNTVIGDPQLGLTIEPKKFTIEAEDKNEYVPFSIYFNNSIGSAMRELNSSDSDGINLLPERFIESLDTRKKAIIFSATSIIATTIVLALASFTIFQFQNTGYQYKSLLSQKMSLDRMIFGARYQEIKEQIGTFNKEIAELSGISKNLFSVSSEIEKIYKLMPKGITITSLKYSDSDTAYDISGIANDRNTLLEAQSNLKKAEFIDQVIAPISNYDERTKISFQMKLKLLYLKRDKYGSSSIAK